MNIYARKATAVVQCVTPHLIEHFIEDSNSLLKKLNKMIKAGFVEITEHVDAFEYKLSAVMMFDDKYPLFEFNQEYGGEASFKAFPFLEIVKEWVDA